MLILGPYVELLKSITKHKSSLICLNPVVSQYLTRLVQVLRKHLPQQPPLIVAMQNSTTDPPFYFSNPPCILTPKVLK